ncbi:MAG: tRNA (adenosine(37)-N6)-threonylcarbamoyltransferase complex dimerization subunit type 1 TsaB [Usitatibacter sp.]
MNLLAVETSTELCSVALLQGDELFAEETVAENRHSELLVPMLRRLLARARVEPRDMDAFAFGQGPGSFTGIRIACGIVQGLAFGAGRPVVPVPSFLALADQTREARVVVAVDARMGEAYLAAYARDGADWNEVIAPRLVDATSVPPLPGRQWVATGSGFDRHHWLREAYLGPVEMRHEADLPRAGAIARVAVRRFLRGAAVPAEQAAPLYLRDKVALTTEERQARK